MITIRYKPKTISHITEEYIELKNDNGELMKILFADCVRGWADYVKNSPDFEGVNIGALSQSKCVGITHKIPKDMYIKLFYKPIIKVEFKFSWRLLEPGDSFDQTKYLISQMGWKTYDMS